MAEIRKPLLLPSKQGTILLQKLNIRTNSASARLSSDDRWAQLQAESRMHPSEK